MIRVTEDLSRTIYESGFKLTGTYIINQLVITKQDVNPIKNINES